MIAIIRHWIDKRNTSQIIALGFAGVIFVGTILLCLPVADASGEGTHFLDAFFTATSAVCVTGLVTLTTATHWTVFGKIVILGLIQMGGLGIITVATLFFLAMGKRISIKNRKMIQESYNLDYFSGMVMIIRKIIMFTFIVESLGAIGYCFVFVPEQGIDGIGNAIFTSVSAFCNAGMDTLGEASLAPYLTNVPVNLITMGLIISGGLGFTVWFDLAKNARQALHSRHTVKYLWRSLKLHSKLAVFATFLFIVGGTLLFFILEFDNPETMGNLSIGHKLLASAFQSVTTRTAGFQTINQELFTDSATVVTIFFMLIGGSPMGTAGGLKTTTFAILVMTVVSYLHGKKDTEVFHRKVKDHNIRTAIVVTCMAVSVLVVGIFGVCIHCYLPMEDLIFEVASALGTVGLSRGITSSLNEFSKVIIIIIMYLGRIGPITLATAITIRSGSVNSSVHLAEDRVLIG